MRPASSSLRTGELGDETRQVNCRAKSMEDAPDKGTSQSTDRLAAAK